MVWKVLSKMGVLDSGGDVWNDEKESVAEVGVV